MKLLKIKSLFKKITNTITKLILILLIAFQCNAQESKKCIEKPCLTEKESAILINHFITLNDLYEESLNKVAKYLKNVKNSPFVYGINNERVEKEFTDLVESEYSNKYKQLNYNILLKHPKFRCYIYTYTDYINSIDKHYGEKFKTIPQ